MKRYESVFRFRATAGFQLRMTGSSQQVRSTEEPSDPSQVLVSTHREVNFAATSWLLEVPRCEEHLKKR